MSKIIPPLLSTTPPPIAAELQDDEFGDFTVAVDSHGCEALSLSIQDEPQSVAKDFQDRRKLDDDLGLVNDVYSCSKVTNLTNNFSNFQYISDVPPDDVYTEHNFSDTVVSNINEVSSPVEYSIQAEESTTLEECTKSIGTLELDSDTVLNYCDITDDVTNQSPVPIESVACDVGISEDTEVAIGKTTATDALDVTALSDDDDDFGNFEAFPAPDDDLKTTSDPFNEFGNFDNQTFGEFGDFSNFPTESADHLAAYTDLQELESLIVDLFPNIEKPIINDYQNEDFFTHNSFVFDQLKDVAETNALSYQWPKSKSQNVLLKALNIDLRNILYGPRWNESMPRYAAALGFAPLEPIKTEIPSPTVIEPTSSSQTVVGETATVQPHSDIPLAQFDWVGSGLVNPLEITPKGSVEKQVLDSTTTVDISILTPTNNKNFDLPQIGNQSQQLDNVSVKSLHLTETDTINSVDEFDDFISYQTVDKSENTSSGVWLEKSIPLRETHISSQDSVEVPQFEWLKPTILTPVLCRRDEATSHFTNDELHDWLQSQSDQHTIKTEEVVHEQGIVETSDVTSASIVNNVCITTPSTNEVVNDLQTITRIDGGLEETNLSDDEFADFQSSVPTETPITVPTLTPITLQPIKVGNSATVIDWPDPGVTDDELKRLEMIYQPANSNTTIVEDDEWSDFVSNQPSTEPTKLQQNHSQITKEEQREAPPVNGFNSFHNKGDLDDEWSDFISGPPVLPNGIHTPSKVTYNISRPPQFTSWTSNVAPNIITNPAALESFQSYTPPLHIDLLKSRSSSKKPNVPLQPKKNTIPSISSIPDLDFIVPKNPTWKK